jgi:hypothetical protein
MAQKITGFKAAHKSVVDLGKKGSFSLHKGALHRALGVPEGEKIPAKKMAQARKSKSQHVRNMARSAAGLKAMGN